MFQSIRVGGTGRDTLVVGYFQGQAFDTTTAKVLKQVDPAGAAAAALKRPESTGDAGAIVESFVPAKGPHNKFFSLLVLLKLVFE